jgi:thiamine-monophosphate kinase
LLPAGTDHSYHDNATVGISPRAGPAGERTSLWSRAGRRADAEPLEAAITVADLGEFGLITAIQELLPADDALIVSVGDDAAVLRTPDGRVVATTDLLVEGRHFRRDWSSAADVGVKAAAQNLADVAAMGASPRTLLVGLACPPDLSADWVLDMYRGLLAECGRAGASIAGGDVVAADAVMLGITALGDLGGRQPVTRAGARPGDQVALAGRLGPSAAGLALLQGGLGLPSGQSGGLDPVLEALVTAHRRPQPPYEAGLAAASAGATAMVDVSDGLMADLGHIALASGVGIDIVTESIGQDPALAAAAALTGARETDWLLTGGEDHALAATFPARAVLPAGWTAIGTVRAGGGVRADGQPWAQVAGWDHFRSSR